MLRVYFPMRAEERQQNRVNGEWLVKTACMVETRSAEGEGESEDRDGGGHTSSRGTQHGGHFQTFEHMVVIAGGASGKNAA